MKLTTKQFNDIRFTEKLYSGRTGKLITGYILVELNEIVCKIHAYNLKDISSVKKDIRKVICGIINT